MSLSITGIPTTGVSTQFIHNQLIAQLNANQVSLYQLETELSTGKQFQTASENPAAASQVEAIQSMLERKDQMKSNVSSTKSLLSQTDSTLTSVANLLTSVQSTALSAVGATANPAERQAAILQIQQAVQELVNQGNQQLAGQQLFGGNNAGSPPFSFDAAGNVVYSGSSASPQTYIDVNRLVNTGVTGDEAFGAMSQPIQGTALTPALSANTPLADLNGGKGIAAGSIAISDGTNTWNVDLRSAQTLGDVALLIEQQTKPSPQAAASVKADVTPTGLTISLQNPVPGNSLSIREVNDNTTAQDLGILNVAGTGTQPIVGKMAAPPTISANTSLDDLFGTKAAAYIHINQPDSDIILQANTPGTTSPDGALLNNVTVQFVADAPAAGQETATFDATNNPGTLTIHISTDAGSASNAAQIVTAINNATIVDPSNKITKLPFTASLDPAAQDGTPPPPLTLTNQEVANLATTTSGGSARPGTSGTLDTAGLQVVSEGKTYTIDVSGDKTVEDLLNSINSSGAGLDAEIKAANNGIDVRSRISGSSFSIGENGGATASQLGIRTFTAATPLSQLNYGQGVGVNQTTPGGTDFTISQTLPGPPSSTVQVNVNIAGDKTVGDVIQSINNTAAKTPGATFRAQLVPTGNGIELVDADSTHGPIVVTANSQSTAATDLGLVPSGQTSAQVAAAPPAQASVNSGVTNGELLFTAVQGGTAGNVQVVFQVANPPITEHNETVNYDPAANTLTFQISTQTTANDIITALQNNASASAAFTVSLDPTNDDGSGVVQPQSVQMTGGQPIALVGRDVNPQETGSVFNALIKLAAALRSNDNAATQRAMGLLSTSMLDLGNARSELGVREQSLSTVSTQIDNEEVNLKSVMSSDYDTDMASVASQFTAAQISYQATLQTTAALLKTTLLNYIQL